MPAARPDPRGHVARRKSATVVTPRRSAITDGSPTGNVERVWPRRDLVPDGSARARHQVDVHADLAHHSRCRAGEGFASRTLTSHTSSMAARFSGATGRESFAQAFRRWAPRIAEQLHDQHVVFLIDLDHGSIDLVD